MTVPSRMLLLPLLFALCVGVTNAVDAPASPAPWRILRAGGPIDDDRVLRHVEFGLSRGFDAVWVRAGDAGLRHNPQADCPPALLSLSRRLASRDARLILAIDPGTLFDEPFIFGERASEKRLARWIRRLSRRVRLDAIVFDYRDAPLRLSELSALLRYGRVAAPAHLELVERMQRRHRKLSFWVAPTVSTDRLFDDSNIRYSVLLLDGMARLDPRIGVVWNGPELQSTSVSAPQIVASRARLGGRPFWLEDRFPANDSGERLALDLVLGPLRERDPALLDRIDGYVSRPMNEVSASRLSLITVADFLDDPQNYRPEISWERAIARLSGDDAAAHRALRTQATEWGGWIGGRNYHTAATSNPEQAANALRDPAAVAATRWPILRYPERMTALAGLADHDFRDGLLAGMARKLTVSRAMPIVRELRARMARGERELGSLRQQLEQERERAAADHPSAALALERFLAAAGMLAMLRPTDPER